MLTKQTFNKQKKKYFLNPPKKLALKIFQKINKQIK